MKKNPIIFIAMLIALAFTSCQMNTDDSVVTPPATEYTVSVTQPDFGGTVSVDKSKAKASETVTITTTANDGFELETISVKNGEATVTVTDKKFTMPSGNVTVNVAFAASSYTVKWDNGIFENKFSLAKVKAYITQIGLVETTHYSIDKKNGVLTFTSVGYAKVANYLNTNGEPTVTETPTTDGGEDNNNGGDSTGEAKDEAISDGNLDIAKAIMFSSNLGTDWGDVIVTNANGQKIKSANAGAVITLTVKPNSGYEAGYLIDNNKKFLLDGNNEKTKLAASSTTGANLELTKVNDTTYTFVMPETIVTIKARFDPVDGYTVTSDYFTVEKGRIDYYSSSYSKKQIKVTPGETFTVMLGESSCKEKVSSFFIDTRNFTELLNAPDQVKKFIMPAYDVAVTTTLKNQQ